MTYLERTHLEIVLAVEREGSMTAAAESLHLTQSALSHSMSKLEDQLGVQIWERKGRQLLPTQAGQYLINTARRLVPQFTRTEGQLIQFSRGERGSLKIGMECHPCYQWLQRITNPYLQDWPSVDLDVIQKFQFAGIEALLVHEIDIIVTPDPVRRPELTFIRTVKYQKIIETTEIMIQMVACGRGVTALPGWLVKEFAERYDIHPVKLGKKGVRKQIHLGIRKEDAKVDYIEAFLEQARLSTI